MRMQVVSGSVGGLLIASSAVLMGAPGWTFFLMATGVMEIHIIANALICIAQKVTNDAT